MAGKKKAKKIKAKPKTKGKRKYTAKYVDLIGKRNINYTDILILGVIIFTFFIATIVIMYPKDVPTTIVTSEGQALEYIPVSVGNDIGIGLAEGKTIITLLNMNKGKDYVYFSKSGDYLDHEAQENSIFVFLVLDVWNADKETYNFNVNKFYLEDSNGFTYEKITFRKGPDELQSAALEKGETSKGTLLFEVPDDAKKLKLKYNDLVWRLE